MHVGMATGFANHANMDDRRFIKEEFDLIRLGNELGLDSVWMTEHHFADYSLSPNPFQYLAYITSFAPRMWLGTQVIVMPWWDPVRVAEGIAVLDHLSGGKCIIGFGRGLARIEFEGFRIDQNTARERFDEGVDIVMQAMETGFVEYDGTIFKIPRREIRPRPIRGLRGRTFAAVGTEGSARAAAKLGLGRLYLNQPMVHSAQGKEAAKKHAEMVGKPGDPWYDTWIATHTDVPPPKPFMSNMTFVSDSADEAWEWARTYNMNTFRWAVKHYEMTSKHHGTIKGYESYSQIVMDPKDVEAAAENVAGLSIAGTPQQVLDKYMERRKAVDPQGFMPHYYTGGMPFDLAARNMRYFAKHCLPEMKSWQVATTFEGAFAQAAENMPRHDPFDPATYSDEAIAPETRAFNAQFLENYNKQPKMYEPGSRRPTGPVPPKSPRAHDRTVEANGREIGVRVLSPDNPRGAYLHIHGGGLVFGSADAQDPMYERIADATGLACVSVEYRLAPAHPYPAAWDDCETAALWLAKNVKAEFGSDRLAIGGESAGATLAVPTLVRMRDRHGFTGFHAANLSYGNFDTTMTPSQTYVGERCGFLGPRDINWCSDQYAPDKKERRNPDMSALHADLRDMPPALFSVGTLDAFLDDSMFVYSRWISSGNTAELAVYPGGLHAFNMFPIPIANEANARIDAFLKKHTVG